VLGWTWSGASSASNRSGFPERFSPQAALASLTPIIFVLIYGMVV